MAGMLCILLMLFSPTWAGELVETGEMEISDSSQDALDAAAKALAERRFDEAALLYAALGNAGGGIPAHYWEALARYEAGDVRGARKAIEVVIAGAPESISANTLYGLILVDGGAVELGIQKLEWVRTQAQKTGDTAVEARAVLNLGLARLDQGDAATATQLFQQAQSLAPQDAGLVAAAKDSLAAAAELSGRDVGVGRLLGKGDVSGARAEAQRLSDKAQNRRDRLEAAILMAAVERTEGRLDSAVSRLNTAVVEARAAGMTRELAMALGQLGIVQSVAGRHALAADALLQGVGEANKGGYRVVEVDLRCELGIVLVRLERYTEAETQQQAAGVLLGQMDYPMGLQRQAELGGMIAAARGDMATATTALARAISAAESAGRPLDAARAATGLTAALEATAPTEADRWQKKAEALFAQAGDPLGPAYIYIARGLSAARAHQTENALRWFAKAADSAKAVGGTRGMQVEDIAREDAAATLVMLGQSEEIAKMASDAGLSELVKRQQTLSDAFKAYDAGLDAYNKKNWSGARQQFMSARQGFEKVQEPMYAQRSQVAAAWASYNENVNLPVAQAAGRWGTLVQEVVDLGDQELYIRSYGAAVMSAVTMGQKDLKARLNECIRLGEGNGLEDVSARCHEALAEADGDLNERAEHARSAFKQSNSEAVGVYALYSVAVEAYNAGRMDLALELATLARPKAQTLAAALDEIIAGAKGH